MNRFVVYSGPSCVGKGPLREVLEENYPKYKPSEQGGEVGRPVLYVSRDSRPEKGEREGHPYRFRTVKQIEEMVHPDPARYISGWVRRDEQFQALDLKETKDILQQHSLVLLEIYCTLGMQVLKPQHLEYLSSDVQAISVFVSPLSEAEIAKFKEKGADLEREIYKIMKRKLDNRATEPPEKREKRAKWAYTEMQNAHRYAHVIPNHDGEDSDNWGIPKKKGDDWNLPYPIGDARRTLEIFLEILEAVDSSLTQHWKPDTL